MSYGPVVLAGSPHFLKAGMVSSLSPTPLPKMKNCRVPMGTWTLLQLRVKNLATLTGEMRLATCMLLVVF